jgi:fibronectin-binding autotransporter adhesin
VISGGGILGTGGLTKNGTGTATFSGSTANTYSGATAVNAGVLALGKSTANVSIVGSSLTIGDGVGSAGTAVVRDLITSQIGSSMPIIINSDGELDLNNMSEAIGNSLTMNDGIVLAGSAGLSLAANPTITVSSTPSIYGKLIIGSGTCTLQGSGALYLYADVSGSANIVKNDSLSVHLYGANTFTGTVTANNSGYVWLGSDQALGGTNGGTILNDSTRLYINGGIDITNEALTLNSTNPITIYVYGNTNSWRSTNFTLSANATIEVATNGALELNGPISGAGGITKTSPGRMRFSGTSANNSYTGPTVVKDGLLELAKSGSYYGIGYGSLTVGDGTGAAGSAIARELASYQLGSIPITVNSDGVLDLNNYSDTVGNSLTLNGGGDVMTGTGTLSLGANSTITASGSGSSISGHINVGSGNCAMNCAGTLSISAVVSGTANITKSGSGTLYLYGANSYSGQTVISEGILQIWNSLALGATSSGTVVSNGASLAMYGGLNVANEALTLNGPGVSSLWGALDAEGSTTNIWGGPIMLNADSTITPYSASTVLDITGPITGSGGVTKFANSAGTLIFSGVTTNTYSGTTTVNAGILELAKTFHGGAMQGPLVVGDGTGTDLVRCMNNSQIWSTSLPVRVNSSGVFDLGDYTDYIGPLTLEGGRVTTSDTGLIWLYGSVTVISNNVKQASIDGQAGLYYYTVTLNGTGHGAFSPDMVINATVRSFGTSTNIGLIKNGEGEVLLTSSNSFAGPVTINGGSLGIGNSFALGNTNTPATVNSGGTLWMRAAVDPVLVGAKPLVLNGSGSAWGALHANFGSCSWAGQVTLASDSVMNNFSDLELSGPITGNGGFTKTGSGTLTLSGAAANTYLGGTYVNAGVLALNKTPTDGAIPHNLSIGSGTVRLLASHQIYSASDVAITAAGRLEMNGFNDYIDGLSGLGEVNLGPTPTKWLVVGDNGGSSTFDGLLSGAGDLYKYGGGTITLNGNNTLTGFCYASAGSLLVNGLQPQSPGYVNSSGTLGGNGTLKDITCLGTLSPGTSPGRLTTSNLTMSASAHYYVGLTGPTPGTDYDQIRLKGTNTIGGAALSVTAAFTKPVAAGQQFTIVANDGASLNTGTFSGLLEGSPFTANNFGFRISYLGGTGNDVVLTLTSVPAGNGPVAVTTGNGSGTLDPNECASLGIGITNKTGTAMTGITATLSSADPNVIVTQPLAAYPSAPANGKSTNSTPFQVSVLPSFVCGNQINLQLAVSSASHGSFIVPVVLPTGIPSAAPARYDNNIVTNVPDIGTIESTNTVATWSGGPITKVAVSLWLVAPSDADLNLTLIAPDGTSVDLSSGNGAGANFGTGNGDANRTTFDDAAATSITAGTPPFVGSFRPEGALASLLGTTATGNWRLRIQDSFGIGSPDTLRGWSLFLYGTTCAPGGGACALCAGGTLLTNTLDTTSASMTTRLFRNGTNSTCAAPTTCPGASTGSFHYQAYPFYNASSNSCVTVTLTSFGGDLMSGAYLGEFTPGDVCLNYLADAGTSTGGATNKIYSFNVPPNSLFTVVVNNVVATGAYSLAVSGGDCPPVLNIQPQASPNVNVSWPTVAGGYQLESSLGLLPPVWKSVTNQPIAASDRYNVTNSAFSSSNRFYRLHKP